MRQDDETTRSDGQPPPEADSERPTVILPASEFRITEVLKHVESGAIVLIIPENGQRAPPAE